MNSLCNKFNWNSLLGAVAIVASGGAFVTNLAVITGVIAIGILSGMGIIALGAAAPILGQGLVIGTAIFVVVLIVGTVLAIIALLGLFTLGVVIGGCCASSYLINRGNS